MSIKLLDSGLWSGEWRLDVGRATLGECKMRLISLLSWVTSVKKFRHTGMNMCRSNTTLFRAHWKK